MENILFNFFVGIVLPFVANGLDRYLPTKPFVKYVVILLVAGLAGTAISYSSGQLNAKDIFTSLTVIATVAQTVYVAFLKKTNPPIGESGTQ